MFFARNVPKNVPVPCRERLCRSRMADAWRRFRRVPQGRRCGVLGYSGGLRGLALDAPKARATIKVVRLRCLGMAVCGQFLAVSNRFLAVCGQFGQFAHGPFWPVFAILAVFGLFGRVVGPGTARNARPLTVRGHRILGGGVDCPSGAQSGAPIDKLRTLCRAPSRPPRPLAAPAPWIA